MRQLYKPQNIEIGARIRNMREEIHLTREEFSEQVELSTQFLTDIERGRMGASLETIIRICDVLGVTTDSVLRGPQPGADETARQIGALLGDVPPELLPLIASGVREQVKLVRATQQLQAQNKDPGDG